METQVFRDIFSTPEQMNSEMWKIKRCTDMKKHLTRRKEYYQQWKLELDSPERNTRMKIDELEAREHLHEGSPDQNNYWKEWRDFTWINGYLIIIYESLKKRGGRMGKNKDNLGWTKQTPLRKLRIDLADGENDGIISKRSAPVGKELTWQPQWSKGLVFT